MKIFDPGAYAALARRTGAEGCVLLRNDGPVLPFAQGAKVAVFGRSQFNYYKSGTGSGGLVNTGHVPSITEGLEASGAVKVDAKLKDIMVNIYAKAAAAAEKYGVPGNYVAGANIAGFEKVVDAMMAQGVV